MEIGEHMIENYFIYNFTNTTQKRNWSTITIAKGGSTFLNRGNTWAIFGRPVIIILIRLLDLVSRL